MTASPDFSDHNLPREEVIAASFTSGGSEPALTLRSFHKECFVIATGRGDTRDSVFAADTAIWAYEHIRTRPHYWEEKRLLLGRIFTTTNLRIFKKRKRKRFAGIGLLIIITGMRKCWIGAVGAFSVYITRGSEVAALLGSKPAKSLLGVHKKCPVSRIVRPRFSVGDTIIGLSGVDSTMQEHIVERLVDGSAGSKDFQSQITLWGNAIERGHRGIFGFWIVRRAPITRNILKL
jgi:hypothetical protein